MANDVDIIIGADSSKLQREVRDATAELDRLRTASERMGRSSVEMDRALAGAAKRLDVARKAAHSAGLELDKIPDIGERIDDGMSRTAKAAALTGDAFGSLAGPIGDVGDAFAMMPPAMAATVVGAGAVVSIFGSIVSSSLDVMRNLDDYILVMDGTEQAVWDAAESIKAFDIALQQQQVTIAEKSAPILGGLANIYISVSDNIGRAIDFIISRTSAGLGAIGSFFTELMSFSRFIVVETGKMLGLSADTTGFIYDSIKSVADTMMGAAFKPIVMAMDAVRALMGQAERGQDIAQQKLDDFNSKLYQQQQWTESWEDFLNDADKADKKRDDSKIERLVKIKDAANDVTDALEKFDADTFTFLTDVADITTSRLAIDVVADISDQPFNDKLDAMKANAAEAANESSNVWKESASGIVNAAASFATSLTGMVSELASRNTANTRAERLKQFRTMKAAALVEASINTALGVTQSLGSAPFPANIVLGALTLAAGGVQIGLIASQQPNFHRGGIMRSDRMGLAGDERSFSATTRANEAVVLTQQAMGAFAGQLSRVNAGEGMGGGMAPVYVMVDGRASPTRQFARPDPMFGRRRLA